MDLCILYVPHDANDWDVTRAIAQVLHSDDFSPRSSTDERLINFKVALKRHETMGVRNTGTGTLTLPSEELAHKFRNWIRDNPIKMGKAKLKFIKPQPAFKWMAQTLAKTPYISPDIEEEYEKKLYLLQDELRVDSVEFGTFHRTAYPSRPGERLQPRQYSVEWAQDFAQTSTAWLKFEYGHKLIRIELGNRMTDSIGSTIAISFSSITKMGLGYDGKPYICFDTLTPPVLERKEFNRTLTGDDRIDNEKYKHRIGSLHPGHARVSPYAQKLRVMLYNDPAVDMPKRFSELCDIAGISKSVILNCNGPNHIIAARHEFFSDKRLYILREEFRKLDWPVAFQLESLLHNCLLHTIEIAEILPKIKALCKQYPENSCLFAAELLRRYGEALQSRPPAESPMACYQRVLRNFEPGEPSGQFSCCHVTFAPTRLILEGPYPTQSNRVIRRYKGYEDNFIRVDFRDEDRLQYRWDRSVDGTSFLHERVGGTLKNGFTLADRRFEFLAYSSSALREHAVWFMHPFQHPKEGWVTASSIRDSLGDFKGTPLLRCPSKYAARLAQAFTATDPSVQIKRGEWEEVDDLGRDPYLHTDGVGTIARKLGDRIWAALCADRHDSGQFSVQPSAYQIRFLGFKGVVSVDEQLDDHPNGVSMRLRGSMKKFENKTAEVADIEIARAFERPNKSYLNRPLVMILENRGVRKEVFEDLQDVAVAEARTIDDSLDRFTSVLRDHSLGFGYRLPFLLEGLRKLGLDLGPVTKQKRCVDMDGPFWRQLRQVAMLDVLREIKHGARVPIPDSYLLVGVADEGPAYESVGHENVYSLKEGQIYACVQNPGDSEPKWLEGSCTISRSPVVHPGDIQRVRAIGKPPEDMLCSFRHLKNVVVLPSVGYRSLASCLGGGDLDGDLYDVIMCSDLLPTAHTEPASYPPGETFTLDRDSEVDDICDFIVEYINSDVLGLLSDRLLVIADQSKDGIFDSDCAKLAALCSQAVDYPKQGIPVDLDNNKLPRTLIRCKPDWHAAEVVSPRHTDFYESTSALGHMYRRILLDDPELIASDTAPTQTNYTDGLTDPISNALRDAVGRYIPPPSLFPDASPVIVSVFRKYADELRYICATHTLSNTPGVALLEAEVVVGTILAKCSQRRWRKDRMWRMRLHAASLTREVQQELFDETGTPSDQDIVVGLERAWAAWSYGMQHRHEFGANSFGLLALATMLNCMERLGELIL